ncbi:hypothetical protein Syun_021503 [Stephania yunnanensis]|uniref:Uncharacterized protein n=1 Tax=Stephania yunnanensis TaxID=152371 RepID=A0AAP0IH70_9MAGN
MASLKAEKPAGSQLFGQVKKDPPKAASEGASKAKPAPKKTEQKPKETKKKVMMPKQSQLERIDDEEEETIIDGT